MQESRDAELVSARLTQTNKWQEGTATVGHTTTGNCPSADQGKSIACRQSGCGNDACKGAKYRACRNLRDAVPAGCRPYITSNKPCKNGPGCN